MIFQSTKPVVWLQLVLIPTLFVGAIVKPVNGFSTCQIPNFSCDRDCRSDSQNFQPQRCDSCCPKNGGGETVGLTGGDSIVNRLATVETTVADLKVMIAVLLALVVLLILAVVFLFLHRCNKIPSSLGIPVVFRQKDKTPKTEKTTHKNCNGVTANGTVSRLANHQSKSSPQTKRSSLNRSISLSTEVETPSRPYRIRQPSESTCPEEGDDINSPRGYDNLALSTSTIDTSTLHNTSTDTLGPALSTHTLQTTLPSDPHFNSHAHNNTQV